MKTTSILTTAFLFMQTNFCAFAAATALATLSLQAAEPTASDVQVSYVAYRFSPEEGWRTATSGDGGATKLQGRTWHYGFIDKMLKLGTPFDVLTVHPYRKTLVDAAFIADLQKVSDQVKLPDGRRRPVWLTEMGWATHVPHHVLRQDFEPVTWRVQAELIARTYLCSIVSGVEPRTFWYNFRNDGDDPFYFEHTLGTLRRDGRPKPAYLAYATLALVLDELKYDRAVEAGEGIFAHRFVSAGGAGREVIAVWNPTSEATAKLKLAAKRVRVTNAVGESSDRETVPGEGGTRVLELLLRAGAPVYVTWDR